MQHNFFLKKQSQEVSSDLSVLTDTFCDLAPEI